MLLKSDERCFEIQVVKQFDEVREGHVIERWERFATIFIAVDVQNENIYLVDPVLHLVERLKRRFEYFRICSVLPPIQL